MFTELLKKKKNYNLRKIRYNKGDNYLISISAARSFWFFCKITRALFIADTKSALPTVLFNFSWGSGNKLGTSTGTIPCTRCWPVKEMWRF